MDLPSSILLSLRIQSTMISRWRLSEPWGVDVVDFDPSYCLSVVEGHCWVEWDGHKPVKLFRGDSLLAPFGGVCALKSAPGAASILLADLPWSGERYTGLDDDQPAAPTQVVWGGGGPESRLLGLAFTFQSGTGDFLLSSLPQFMILRRNEAGILPLTHPAMESLIDDASPGYFAVARQLAELIIISLLRAHIFSSESQATGWLRGLQDGPIARVLSAIHTNPQRSWTVSRLASVANMSRSAFAGRFSQLVGLPPIEYLNQWRSELAADQLRTTRQSMDSIARDVGYSTDRVFRRTFKQRFGMSPMQYRKKHRDVSRA